MPPTPKPTGGAQAQLVQALLPFMSLIRETARSGGDLPDTEFVFAFEGPNDRAPSITGGTGRFAVLDPADYRGGLQVEHVGDGSIEVTAMFGARSSDGTILAVVGEYTVEFG